VAYGRVSLRVTREILRLKFEARLSHRQIGRACGASCSTVSEAVGRFQASTLTYEEAQELDEAALQARLYPGNSGSPRRRSEADYEYLHRELRRPGVTL